MKTYPEVYIRPWVLQVDPSALPLKPDFRPLAHLFSFSVLLSSHIMGTIPYNERRKNGSVEVKNGLKADEWEKAASGQGLRALASLLSALHHPGHLDLPGVHICYWCRMSTCLQRIDSRQRRLHLSSGARKALLVDPWRSVIGLFSRKWTPPPPLLA